MTELQSMRKSFLDSEIWQWCCGIFCII